MVEARPNSPLRSSLPELPPTEAHLKTAAHSSMPVPHSAASEVDNVPRAATSPPKSKIAKIEEGVGGDNSPQASSIANEHANNNAVTTENCENQGRVNNQPGDNLQPNNDAQNSLSTNNLPLSPANFQNNPVQPANSPRRLRVKVFVRGPSEEDWSEAGTGHLFTGVEEDEGMEAPVCDEQRCLHVISETDNTKILQTQIDPNCNHDKQEDTIIVWAESNRECALSFQNRADCDEIFNYIQSIKNPSCSSDFAVPSESYIELPRPDLAHLEQLADTLEQCVVYTDTLEYNLESGDYLNKTIEMIRICIDNKELHGSKLKFLSRICLAYIYFNKQHILDVMFSWENILTTIQALQVDGQSGDMKFDHKNFLEKETYLKHLISATRDDLLCKKIEHTFMLQYVLDNFFPSHNMVEKARIQSLYNAISLYNFEIISIVLEHADEVQSLIDSIKIPMDNATTLEQMRFSCDVLCFFKELCVCVTPLDRKEKFFAILNGGSFYKAIYILLKREKNNLSKLATSSSEDELKTGTTLGHKIFKTAIELIIKLIDFNTIDFYYFTFDNELECEKSGDESICEFLIGALHAQLFDIANNKILPATNADLITDVASVIGVFSELLGYSVAESQETKPVYLNRFKADFYSKYAPKIFKPLTMSIAECDPDQNYSQWHGFMHSTLLQFLCQILNQAEDFTICFNFLKRNCILEKMGHLCSSPTDYLDIDLTLLLQALLFANDSVVQEYLSGLELFRGVFTDVASCHLVTNDMVSGALSNILDRMRLNCPLKLQEFVVNNFDSVLSQLTLNSCYQDLKSRVEHCKENVRNSNAATSLIDSLQAPTSTSEDNNASVSFNDTPDDAKINDENRWMEGEIDSKEELENKMNFAKDNKEFDKQYENIFFGLNSSGMKKSLKVIEDMPGLYSPRPGKSMKKQLNFKLDLKPLEDDDNGVIDPAAEISETIGNSFKSDSNNSSNPLVDYSSSDDEQKSTNNNNLESNDNTVDRQGNAQVDESEGILVKKLKFENE